MLKRTLQILTLVALVNLAYQYWPRSGGWVIPVQSGEGKYGFVDGDGRVRLEFEWDSVMQVGPEGDTKVIKDGLFGIVDYSGVVVVKPVWAEVKMFNEYGLAKVSDGELFGLIDRSGKMVAPVEWVEIDDSNISKGYIVCYASGRKRGLMDQRGNVVIEPVWDNLAPFGPQGIAPVETHEDGWSLIDREGDVVVKIHPKYSTIGRFGTNGLAMVEVVSPGHVVPEPKGRVGWIDVSGEMVIPIEWQNSKGFESRGLAAVQLEDKWGWIDESGKVVLPLEWDEVTAFNEWGLARVLRGGWGAINKKGEIVIPLTWAKLEAFDKGGIAKVEGGMWPMMNGLVHVDGSVVAEPAMRRIGQFDEQGDAWVEESGKCGIIDRQGNVRFMIPGQADPYEAWKGFDRNDRTFIMPSSVNGPNDQFGWINRDGEVVIAIPKSWNAMNSRDWIGVYTISRLSGEVGWLKKCINKVTGWITGSEPSTLAQQCRAYDKDGKLFWSSKWMRKEVKAWMWLIAALLPLLIVNWKGRRKTEVRLSGY